MPPPLMPAVLPLTVESESVREPKFQMPPPNKPAVLPLTVELVSVMVPRGRDCRDANPARAHAPCRSRFRELRFHKPLLYPLSYGGPGRRVAGASAQPWRAAAEDVVAARGKHQEEVEPRGGGLANRRRPGRLIDACVAAVLSRV
jgi:hypothetical protein